MALVSESRTRRGPSGTTGDGRRLRAQGSAGRRSGPAAIAGTNPDAVVIAKDEQRRRRVVDALEVRSAAAARADLRRAEHIA